MPIATLRHPRRAPAPPRQAASTDEHTLRRLVEFAVLAPSGHNAQPWRFHIRDGVLELRADRTRSLPVVDPDDRELTISCGAALGFLRVAVRALARTALIRRLPDPRDPDLLATLALAEPCDATLDEVTLFAAIRRRHTHRRPFASRLVPERVVELLADVPRMEGAWVRVLSAPGEKAPVADLVAEGDRRQGADPAFRHELASWIHPNHSRARDGMRAAVFGVPDLASVAFPGIIRSVDWGSRQAARDRRLACAAPALLVLGTEQDTPEAWLRCGEALAMLLLHACVHGVSASFLNQPVEVPALRTELARVLGVQGRPQLVLRIGYGHKALSTPRRALDDVLVE